MIVKSFLQFSSSKESVLRILATLRISILRMKQMFDSKMLWNILCLPIHKGCKTKCKPSVLPPPLEQTCQFPTMSFSSHNKANCSFTFTTIQARPLYEAYVLGSVSSDPTLLNRAATTPGTSCPTLFDKCVGSLTSHRIF